MRVLNEETINDGRLGNLSILLEVYQKRIEWLRFKEQSQMDVSPLKTDADCSFLKKSEGNDGSKWSKIYEIMQWKIWLLSVRYKPTRKLAWDCFGGIQKGRNRSTLFMELDYYREGGDDASG